MPGPPAMAGGYPSKWRWTGPGRVQGDVGDQAGPRPDGARHLAAFLRRGLARVPFATALWLAVAAVGIWTGTWRHELHPAKLQRWGEGLEQLWNGRWWTLLTDTVFVHGPVMYWGILAFIPVSVGVYEWLAGSRRALVVFWLTDIAGSLAVALGIVLPLYLSGIVVADLLPFANDVGMSGGGFGCVGATMRHLPRRRRRPITMLITVYLLLHFATLLDFGADTLHLLTFGGGLVLGRWLGRDAADPTDGEDPCRA